MTTSSSEHRTEVHRKRKREEPSAKSRAASAWSREWGARIFPPQKIISSQSISLAWVAYSFWGDLPMILNNIERAKSILEKMGPHVCFVSSLSHLTHLE